MMRTPFDLYPFGALLSPRLKKQDCVKKNNSQDKNNEFKEMETVINSQWEIIRRYLPKI